MSKITEYAIPYEHMADELVNDKTTRWHFYRVKEIANENKLELSDDDFRRLFKLSIKNKDIDWIMYQMSEYNQSLIDALVSYITY